MQQFAQIEFEIEPTNPESKLEFEVWIDFDKIFDGIIVDQTIIKHKIVDDEKEHELKFILKNKSDNDTVIDETGNIIKDSLINIKNIKFDDIELGYIFTKLSQYNHNHNGHSEPLTEKFFGIMGCNGTVSLKFNTPIYLWLLENM